MSSYHLVDVNFKDEPLLVKTLRELGYSPEVHEEAKVLGGNYNRDKVKAHVIVPRSQYNGTYGDVGFERTKKGFVMHADHIDIKKFKMKELNKKYSENKLRKYVSTTSRCNIFSRRENNNGQIEIHLRVQQ